jgi:hypothetical protein
VQFIQSFFISLPSSLDIVRERRMPILGRQSRRRARIETPLHDKRMSVAADGLSRIPSRGSRFLTGRENAKPKSARGHSASSGIVAKPWSGKRVLEDVGQASPFPGLRR